MRGSRRVTLSAVVDAAGSPRCRRGRSVAANSPPLVPGPDGSWRWQAPRRSSCSRIRATSATSAPASRRGRGRRRRADHDRRQWPVAPGRAARLRRSALRLSRARSRVIRTGDRPDRARPEGEALRRGSVPDARCSPSARRDGLSDDLLARADLRLALPMSRRRLEPQPRDGGLRRPLRPRGDLTADRGWCHGPYEGRFTQLPHAQSNDPTCHGFARRSTCPSTRRAGGRRGTRRPESVGFGR